MADAPRRFPPPWRADKISGGLCRARRAVERSRRWDPIFRGGTSRPASNDDAVVFPKTWSGARANDQKPVVEKTDLSVEATDPHASVGVTDTVNAAPTMPDELILDELRRALGWSARRGASTVRLPGSSRL
jgi:hypothetical protein